MAAPGGSGPTPGRARLVTAEKMDQELPMLCWRCERPAHAVCIFCGRAVCKDHAQKLPNILGVFTAPGGTTKVIAVEDAIYCGECRPRDDAVPLESLR